MNKFTKIILLIFFAIVFIGSLTYIVNYQYKAKLEGQRLEELNQQLIESPNNTDIVEETPPSETQILAKPQNQETPVEESIVPEEVTEPQILSKYENLYQENPDLIGWISIDNTVIDYPVMQTIDDPLFYNRRDWDKNDSKHGTPFIDARCTLEGNNFIIYSHNMKDGTMFGSLKKYKEKSYYEEHPIIKFDTIYEECEYQIIAVLLTKVYYDEIPSDGTFEFYNYPTLDSSDDFNYYVDSVKQLSLYEIEETAQYGDSLITLCTCSYHTDNGRLLVVAKKIQ